MDKLVSDALKQCLARIIAGDNIGENARAIEILIEAAPHIQFYEVE